MATIGRIRVPWTGGVGGNGLSTFYFNDAPAALPSLRTFFDSIKSSVAIGISWTFFGEGDTIESTTGQITGTWSTTGQAQVTSSGSGIYAAPVGGMINWLTGAVYFGHRIKGRTFIVPLVGSQQDAQGTLSGTCLTTLGNAAAALIAASPGNMLVWSRPTLATPAWTDVRGVSHPAKTAHDGYAVSVVAHSVPDKSVVLRSRRD